MLSFCMVTLFITARYRAARDTGSLKFPNILTGKWNKDDNNYFNRYIHISYPMSTNFKIQFYENLINLFI
jgi:hypothetical protein